MPKSWIWCMGSILMASVAVGLATRSAPWGVTAMCLLLALRNCVMSGYVEGVARARMEIVAADSVRERARDKGEVARAWGIRRGWRAQCELPA